MGDGKRATPHLKLRISTAPSSLYLASLRHQRSELSYANRCPPISLVSDCVKRQDVPAPGSHPFGDFVVSRNLAAAYVESVKAPIAADGIVGSRGTSPRLLISSIFHNISKVGVRAIERIAKGRDLCFKPALDQFFGLTGFG